MNKLLKSNLYKFRSTVSYRFKSSVAESESAILWKNPVSTSNFTGSEFEEGLPVSYEDISRAMYRIRSGVKRTVDYFYIIYYFSLILFFTYYMIFFYHLAL